MDVSLSYSSVDPSEGMAVQWLDEVVHTVIPATQKAYIGRLRSKDSPDKSRENLSEK
jgi:hypothetical protein